MIGLLRRVGLKRLLLPLLAVVLMGGLWIALGSPQRAPQVSFTTIEGKHIVLSDLKGRVVLVNFWATSCPGCVAEMPGLIESHKRYQAKGFEVIAVAMLDDPPSHVVNFVKKNGLPFPVVLDSDGTLAKLFGDVQVTPTAFIIDPQGNIVQRVMGELDFPALHALLDEKLGSKT